MTLPHLNPPLTKGRRLAERNLGKNGKSTPTKNPEAPKVQTLYHVRSDAKGDGSA
jgi:hypothetical protein